MSVHSQEYDVVGIGFGPANLAIAIALEEQSDLQGLRYCFLEKQPRFEWHGGMLLEGTRMQVSFLKDLATLRNPASRFTFVNYLHDNHRLDSFINMGTFFPTRVEYNDYMRWSADQFQERVHYGQEVIAIEPVEQGGEVEWVRIRSRNADGSEKEIFTRNLVIGIGGYPKIPAVFAGKMGDNMVHSSRYKHEYERFGRHETPRIAVIGAGQSAAEIYLDLMDQYPDGKMDLVSRSRALHPADDSAFVNEIFDPAFTDTIYSRPESERQDFLKRFSQTNYAVVDLAEIEQIYERLYLQKVTGKVQHRFLSNRDIVGVQNDGTRVLLTLRNKDTGVEQTEVYDGVVLATGYNRNGHEELLSPMADWMSEQGVERCYRLPMAPGCHANVFLQGCCEETHGLSDTLLSILAVRSQEVVDALIERQRRPAATACAS